MQVLLLLLCAGVQDDLQLKLARSFSQPDVVDPDLIAAGRSSSSFATRYVAAIVQIKDTLARGGPHERCHQALAALSGPPAAADHLKALAASFKDAMFCEECRNGKVVCGQCQGKKRTEVKCQVCEGKGRVGAPGAVDKSQVTQKCRNCDGKAVFRDVRCPSCSGTGLNDCPSCLGSPWHDRGCSVKECRSGRVPCPQCRGKGRVEATCPSCQGKGRVGAPGAVDPSQVTQRCNDCDGKGVLKDRPPCPTCDGSSVGMGFVKCAACREGRKASAAPLSSVFETDPCPECGGKTGACAKCFGLGVRIRPAAAPSKTLD